MYRTIDVLFVIGIIIIALAAIIAVGALLTKLFEKFIERWFL